VTAGWARPGPGPGRQRVAALGGGPPVVAVVAVVHAGPHVHPETSLGLLFDLGDGSLGPVPGVSGHRGGG